MSAQLEEVPGAARLLGRGVFTSVSTKLTHVLDDLPHREVVVAGAAAEAAAATLLLADRGCQTTFATTEDGRRVSLAATVRERLRANTNVTLCYGTEVTWAVGLDHLEAVILRHVPTGRIQVRNAAALFLLPPEPTEEP